MQSTARCFRAVPNAAAVPAVCNPSQMMSTFGFLCQTNEAQDPNLGGLASGAMPEEPKSPDEPPNQKHPSFGMEVPSIGQ